MNLPFVAGRRPSRFGSAPLAVASLLAVNLLPLAGVLWFGWSVGAILVVYWLESGIIGALNVPKILLARGESDPDSTFSMTVNGRTIDPGTAGNAAMAAFFCMHYGIFWVVHGVFVFLFAFGFFPATPTTGPPSVGGLGAALGGTTGSVLLAALAMAVSHGVSFAVNYLGNEEYRRVSPAQRVQAPYGRVMVLHITIIGGAFLVASLGSPVGLLVVMVLLKTGLDVVTHLREHRTSESERVAEGGPTTGDRRTG